MFKKQFLYIATVALSATLFSCKKDAAQDLAAAPVPQSTPAQTPANTQTTNQLNAAAYASSQDYYLWNTQLPAVLSSNYADPAALMTGIRQYSMESGFSAPVDRWSFAMKKTEWDQYSGGMSSVGSADGVSEGDFGITVFFRAEGDLRVRLSEPNSPAGLAGVRRGWRIIKINGNTNVTTGNANFIIDNIYNSTYSTFTFQRPNGSMIDLPLSAAHYSTRPVLFDSVYNTGTHKAGYLVYSSFLGNINNTLSEYARVFNKFASEGVTDLIIDLRYNGGGYVDLQSKLANYIINASNNGALMMRQMYNTAHSSENSTNYFQKAGSVNVSRVYFIVSRSTASASELLINNLKPYMDVRLIGTSNTHGKPVGFFPIEDGDWYVFPVSFKTVNKNNEGNYYSGFAPNALVADGLDKDWGDPAEASLASALQNISTGSYNGVRAETYNEPISVSAGNAALEKDMIKITIGTKKY